MRNRHSTEMYPIGTPMRIQARQESEAERQYEAAVKALEPMGNRADGLRALARFVVDRKT